MDGARTADDRAAWDLVSVARGMAVYLQERALDHTDSRVQFPGLFRDVRGRDGIAKFGAVQTAQIRVAVDSGYFHPAIDIAHGQIAGYFNDRQAGGGRHQNDAIGQHFYGVSLLAFG